MHTNQIIKILSHSIMQWHQFWSIASTTPLLPLLLKKTQQHQQNQRQHWQHQRQHQQGAWCIVFNSVSIEYFINFYPFFTCSTPLWDQQWSPVTIHEFCGQTGPKNPLPSCILGLFKLFFTSSLMSTIVQQTNLYAREVLGEEKFMKWTPVTEEELWAYLGFSILMAVNHLPSIADCWKLDEVYHYAPIASRISRDRFLDISRFLHFVDNSTLLLRTDPNFDRLQKVHVNSAHNMENARRHYGFVRGASSACVTLEWQKQTVSQTIMWK